jgi:TPR repeat protein
VAEVEQQFGGGADEADGLQVGGADAVTELETQAPAAAFDADPAVAAGFTAFEAGDLAGAEAVFAPAAAEGGRAAMFGLGLVYQARDDFDQAVRCTLLAVRGENDAAVAWLSQAVALGSSEAAVNLGRMNHWDNPAEAEFWYRRGAEAEVGSAMANIGVLAQRRGDLAQAAEWYRKAVEAGEVRAVNNLGNVLLMQGEVEEAMECFRRGADDGDGHAQVNFALLSLARGEIQEALIAASQGRESDAPGAEVVFGQVLLAMGDADGAAEAFNRAMQSGDPAGAYALGVVAAQKGALIDAERLFLAAAGAGHVPAMWNSAVLLHQGGRGDEAMPWFEAAANAGHPEAIAVLSGAVQIAEAPAEGS